MKKIKCLLLLCLFAIITTGCVKFNANMNIKKDKSMEFSIIYAFDKTIFGEDNKLKEDDFTDVKKQGFTLTKYSEGNYEGFTLTKKIANIDEVSSESDVIYDLSGMMSETSENKYIFKVVKGADKNTYTAKLKFNANDSGLNSIDDTEQETPDEVLTTGEDTETIGASDDLDNMDFSGMMGSMDLSFNVTLPNSAISSNATTKENNNKKLTWKLATDKQEYIEFAFELSNNVGSNNLVLYIGIGVIALVAIAAFVIVASKKKNNTLIEPVPKKNNE